jgi:hypothetical protein
LPTDIKTDGQGYSYIKGWHADSTHFDEFLLTNPYSATASQRKRNKFIGKFDPDGNTVWVKSISERCSQFDYNTMDIDPEGNVYFGVQVRDTINFGDEFTYINAGLYDLFVAKYTSGGLLDWVKTMEGDDGQNWLSSVTVYNENTIFAAGFFNDYLSFGSNALTSSNTHGFVTLIGESTGIYVYRRPSENQLFNVCQNPVNDLLALRFLKENRDCSIEILDNKGTKVYSASLSPAGESIRVNVNGLSPGIYFIRVITDEASETEKFIIN